MTCLSRSSLALKTFRYTHNKYGIALLSANLTRLYHSARSWALELSAIEHIPTTLLLANLGCLNLRSGVVLHRYQHRYRYRCRYSIYWYCIGICQFIVVSTDTSLVPGQPRLGTTLLQLHAWPHSTQLASYGYWS